MKSSRWPRWTTIAAVLMLALIAAVVSYSHMYELALRHGEPEWRAALFPLSVDGMIVGASMTLLSDARHGRKGGLLPWALLIIGSGASLAANVAVADPTMWSRIIHAWPSFALIGAYELLMREFRTVARSVRSADAERTHTEEEAVGGDEEAEFASVEQQERWHLRAVKTGKAAETEPMKGGEKEERVPPQVQRDAWKWALENRQPDGSLPTGEQIAARFGRKERWGRLIKQWGQQGRLALPPVVTPTGAR
nr:DUF2637 domain-containing protein [Nocardiopsis sp. FR6]